MRDRAELNAQLFEQLDFIETSSREFDAGKLHEAKRIANAIYTIVVDKSRTVSILRQLKVKDEISFLASGTKYDPLSNPEKTRFQSPPLVRIVTGQNGFEYTPRLDQSPKNHRMLEFENWWNKDAIFWYRAQGGQGPEEKTMSRKDLVSSLTDQDGGRHLDQQLTDANYRYLKGNHDFRNMETGLLVAMSTELVTVRQIGWELVESLRQYERSTNIEIANPKLYAEIRDKKLSFFPSKRGFYNSPELEGKLESGRTYDATIIVDRLTKGAIRMVGNGVMAEPISTAGTYSMRIVAGNGSFTGVLGEFTDAIVDKITFNLVQE
jgi:hypothetical protein